METPITYTLTTTYAACKNQAPTVETSTDPEYIKHAQKTRLGQPFTLTAVITPELPEPKDGPRASFVRRDDLPKCGPNGRNPVTQVQLVLDGVTTTPVGEYDAPYMCDIIGLTDADFGYKVTNATKNALGIVELNWLKENNFLDVAVSRHGLREFKDRNRSTCYAVIRKHFLGRKMASNRAGTCWFSGKKFEAGAVIWWNPDLGGATVLDSEVANLH